MTGMTRQGVEPRARALRNAANLLRWEIDIALGVWPDAHTPTDLDGVNVAAVVRDEIAETLGIVRAALDVVEARLPEQDRAGILTGDLHQVFAERVTYYHGYHRVGR